jgi:CBS domain-containing protein
MPFLEWDPPRISHVMVCKEAMETEYPQLEEVDSVANIFKVIREENIGNVPVVQKGDDGFKLKVTLLKIISNGFQGSIPKLHLKVLLANRAFESDGLIDVNSVR